MRLHNRAKYQIPIWCRLSAAWRQSIFPADLCFALNFCSGFKGLIKLPPSTGPGTP